MGLSCQKPVRNTAAGHTRRVEGSLWCHCHLGKAGGGLGGLSKTEAAGVAEGALEIR